MSADIMEKPQVETGTERIGSGFAPGEEENFDKFDREVKISEKLGEKINNNTGEQMFQELANAKSSTDNEQTP